MPKNFPDYFSILSESDQSGYFALQAQVSSLCENRRRGQRVPTFIEILELIHRWAQRDDPDDWKRCLVCGLYYLPSGVAVNSHQLRFLTGKCKSAINGALKMIGLTTVSARGDVNPDLVKALPALQGKTHAMRQWSVRRPAGQKECEDETEESAVLEKSVESSGAGQEDLELFNQWEDDSCGFFSDLY
jgi:hypothetical protein